MTLRQSDAPKTVGSPLPVRAIVAMVGKGMTAQEILSVFPELSPDDVRAALLCAAEVVVDTGASLRDDDLAGVEASARRASNLQEAEATDLAVQGVRAARQSRAEKPPS